MGLSAPTKFFYNIFMQKQVNTPAGESTVIDFNSNLITISQLSPNHVTIVFDEISRNLRHQVINHQLSKVNFKTIVSSLKGLHPNILSAKLQKNADEIFVMTIKVSYEFLPQIQQAIMFEKRQLNEEETKQIGARNLTSYIKNIKEQIAMISNLQVITNQINQKNHQQYIKLNHPKSLITWTLILKNPSNNIIKPQMYTLNSATKQKINTRIVPEDGLYVYHNGGTATTEMRFLAEHEDQYDQVILELAGDWKGKSIVSIEHL